MNTIHHSLVGKKIRSSCDHCGKTKKSAEVDARDLHAITVITKAFEDKHKNCLLPEPEPVEQPEPEPKLVIQGARLLSGTKKRAPAVPSPVLTPASTLSHGGGTTIAPKMNRAQPAKAAEMTDEGKVEQIGFVRGQTVVSGLGSETKVVEHPREP